MITGVFDVGGLSTKYAVMDTEANIIEQGHFPSEKYDFQLFMERMADTAEKLKQKYNIKGVALSVPGAVDESSGIIQGASALPCIHGLDIKENIRKHTGLDAEMENDANCAALGEMWKGAAQGVYDFASVVVGHGIGGAIIKNRMIHRGAHLHGGEYGYCVSECVRNPQGNLEVKIWSDLGATGALIKKAAAYLQIPDADLTGVQVFSMAEAGDRELRSLIDRFYLELAKGIINIQYTYDPEVILVGGGISQREDFVSEIEKRVDEIIKEIRIAKIRPILRKCQFKNDANLVGALYNYLLKQNFAIKI